MAYVQRTAALIQSILPELSHVSLAAPRGSRMDSVQAPFTRTNRSVPTAAKLVDSVRLTGGQLKYNAGVIVADVTVD